MGTSAYHDGPDVTFSCVKLHSWKANKNVEFFRVHCSGNQELSHMCEIMQVSWHFSRKRHTWSIVSRSPLWDGMWQYIILQFEFSVCLFVWVCEIYVVHHLVSTGLRCAPSTCTMNLRCATWCTRGTFSQTLVPLCGAQHSAVPTRCSTMYMM